MFLLAVDIHWSDVDSLYWEKLHRHAPSHILRMSVNGGSTIFSFETWVFMFRLVVDIHLSDIDSLYWKKLQEHGSCHILIKSVNGASTIISLASWVIYIPIGCRDPFIR